MLHLIALGEVNLLLYYISHNPLEARITDVSNYPPIF